MLGFDIEPDRRVVDLQNPSWKGAENLFGRFETLRRQVQAAGIEMRVTWFARADPQIKKANGESEWALRRFQGQLRSAEQAGDEIALHMHPWRWAGSDEGWVQDFSDDSWILECLDISMRSFSRVFGRFPCAYRGGDRYMSNSIVRALEKRGVQVDFTLERVNGVERLVDNENSTGQIPDCSSVPAKAFRASRSDFRIPSTDDCRALAMCPLTAAGEATLVPWTDRLVFEEQLETLMNDKEALTHLAFVARSDLALLPEWEEFEANVHALARYARQGQLIFATATDTGRQAGLPS